MDSTQRRDQPDSPKTSDTWATLPSIPELLGQGVAVVIGDRRDEAVRQVSDVLLQSAWTDIVGLARLPRIGNADVLPDHLFVQALAGVRPEELGLNQRLISLGAADTNFATLCLLPIFAFQMAPQVRDRLFSFFLELDKLPAAEGMQKLAARRQELAELRRQLSPPEVFYDPMDPSGRRAPRPVGRLCGLVSVAVNPFSDDQLAFIAAGVCGALTAGAGKVAAGVPILDPYQGNQLSSIETRPLGGLFRRRRQASLRPPHDVLTIERDLEWATPPYSVAECIDALERHAEHGRTQLTIHDVQRLKDLLRLPDRSGIGRADRAEGTWDALIPTGGKGTRMHVLTQGECSKLDLPLGIDDRGQDISILELAVRSLLSLPQTRSVELLSTPQFSSRQKIIAAELADATGKPCSVVNEESDGFENTLRRRICQRLDQGRCCALFMADMLIQPADIEDALQRFYRERPAMAILCAHAVPSENRRYGVVQIDRGSTSLRVRRLVEKPGHDLPSLISLGAYLFSPIVAYERVFATVQNEFGRPPGLVDIVNFLAARMKIVAYDVHEEFYDCGSEDGYERAQHAARRGGFAATLGAH